MGSKIQLSRQPVICNSPDNLVMDIVDIMVHDNSFIPMSHFKPDERPRVRRAYIDQVVGEANHQIDLRNSTITRKRDHWQHLQRLSETCVAHIIIAAEPARRLRADKRVPVHQSALALYDPESGTFDYDAAYTTKVVSDYSPTKMRTINGISHILASIAPGMLINQNPDLINFKNGVLDRKNKKLLPHSADYGFTAMLETEYDPNAENPHFTDSAGEDWDIETWMSGLSDDPSVVDVLWETVAACMRPGVRWNKTPWLYSTTGANGKGSLCELIRTVIGPTSTASLTVKDFGSDFMTSQLLNTTCVVTDENPVGTVIDQVSSFKAAVTGDIFTVNRKYHDPMRMSYQGIILQCMNSMPIVRDRTGSFYRRQLFIPMEKSFAHIDKPEIKSKFLTDEQVCRYVAKRCMDMQFEAFSNPSACAAVLEEYKTMNDQVREFASEILPLIPWRFVSYQFLYDLYVAWHDRNYPGQKAIGRSSCIRDLRNAVAELGGWTSTPLNGSTVTVKAREDELDLKEECELLEEYELVKWQRRISNTTDPKKIQAAGRTLDPTKIPNRGTGLLKDESVIGTRCIPEDEPEGTDTVFESAFSLINTTAHHRRDYGCDADDSISKCVAAQLAADPHAADTVYDHSVSEFVIEAIPEDSQKLSVKDAKKQIQALLDGIESDEEQ